MSKLNHLTTSNELVDEATTGNVNDVQALFHALLQFNATAHNYDNLFVTVAQHNVSTDALLTDAKLDQMWNYDFVVSALKHGMSPDLLFKVAGLHIALPCCLARSGHLSVLRQLLDDGVITFSACAVTPEDMWEHLTVVKADIPVLCAVMEHFGAALQGPCHVYLVHWIESNRMLMPSLTAELSITPTPASPAQW
jgi:hypothetical protein